MDPKKFNELNKEAVQLNEALLGISATMNEVAQRAARATGDTEKSFKTQSNQAEKLAKKLEGMSKEELKGLKKNKELRQDLVKLEGEMIARRAKMEVLQDRIKELYKKGTEAAIEEADALSDVLATMQEQNSIAGEVRAKFEEIADTVEEIESINPFKTLSEVVNDVPILGKVMKNMSAAAEEFDSHMKDGESRMSAMLKTSKSIGSDLLKGFMAFAVGSAVDGVKRLDENAVNLEKSLNMGTKEAINFQKSLIETTNSIPGLTAAHLNESLRQANEALGTTAVMSTDTLATFATMTKQMGMAADEAGKLNQFTLATGQNFQDFTNEAIGSVKILNLQNDTQLDYKDILKDINGISNAVKLSTQAQGRNLAEAAYQAKKMGLSMSELDGIAGGLLDFEQSIANELEAELLLGKDLNLEKARAAALDNDLVTLGEELQKQGITQEKFANMSRIEQESIAKAMGMTRDSMADMFVKQSAITALGGKQGDDVQALLKAKMDQIMLIEDEEKREAALAALKKETGMAEMVDKQRAQTLAEKAQEAQIKMADNLAKAMPTDAIVAMKDGMDRLNQSMDKIAIAIGLLAVAIGGVKVAGLIKRLGKIKGSLNGIKSAGDDMAKGLMNNVDEVGKAASQSADVASDAAKATKAASSTAKGADMAGDAAKATKTAASGGKGFFGKAFDFVSNTASKAKKAVGGALDAVNPMSYIKKFFKGGGGIGKLLKKLPGIGALIAPAIAAFEISQAAGSGGNPQDVGAATLEALGSLGGGALGAVLGSLIPVPVVGTMLGGLAGDYIGRMVAGLVAENMDMSGLGNLAINTFGGQEDIEMAEGMAADFISRPGQPIQKFRPDDIVIGATNPLGGGGGDERTVQLLERLVSAVEKGGVINMDGNKVGTVLGMTSYRTQ